MKISRNIRTQFGLFLFNKEIKKIKRETTIVNFNEASNIGLLYDATDERDTETIKNYVKSVRANTKKDILAMGFVDRKTVHQSQYAQYGLDFFTRKDLNFKMIPSDPIVKNFIEEKFDILVNLNSGNSFPLKYISALSRAKFKVGRYGNGGDECFDLLVKIEGEPPLKSVIEEIEHFLKIIHTS